MRKIFALFLIITLLPICIALPTTAEASISVSVSSNIATIIGSVPDMSGLATVLVDAPDGQIYYVGTAYVINGAIETSFQMQEPKAGMYSVKVKTPSMVEPYTTSFMYGAVFATATMVNGFVTVKGSLTGGAGKWVNILTYNGNEVDYASDTTCNSSGSFTFEYQSETLDGLDIKLMAADLESPVTVPVGINVRTNQNNISISGKIQSGKWVTVAVYDALGNIDYISDTTCNSYGDYSFEYVTESSGELTVYVSADGLDMPYEANIEILPNTTIVNPSTLKIYCEEGKSAFVAVTVQNIDMSGGRTFEVTYDPLMLEISNLTALEYTITTTCGVVDGTPIEILNIDDGIITFRYSDANNRENFSGTINLLKFVAIVTDDEPTIVKIETL